MIRHCDINDWALRKMILEKKICLAGNARLRIYGTLGCRSGKRMKREHRVFFSTPAEAMQLGFRPCGHCMHADYQKWKNEIIQL